MKKLLNLKRSEYEDKTNISIMPEDWRKIYRALQQEKNKFDKYIVLFW